MAQTNAAVTQDEAGRSFQGRITEYLANFPWWGLVIAIVGVILAFKFATDETYSKIFSFLSEGVILTITITLMAYFVAVCLGLTTALMQLSSNVITRNVAQLYVQVVRGVPIIVQITYWVVVLFPLFVTPALNGLGEWLGTVGVLAPENALTTLKIDNIARGVVALAFSYGAFSSEIFRAGIQSIEKGQREAASALGLTWFQSFRFIVLPQALRRVLPPLGNDFIAMLKESSLLSAVGVNEITLQSKQYAARSFLFLQTYNTSAFLYLTMTLLLSLGVRTMERRMKAREK